MNCIFSDLNRSNPLFQSADGTENIKLLLKYVKLTQALLAKRSAAKNNKPNNSTQGLSESSNQTKSNMNVNFLTECFHDRGRSIDISARSLLERWNFDYLQSAENNSTYLTSQSQRRDNSSEQP